MANAFRWGILPRKERETFDILLPSLFVVILFQCSEKLFDLAAADNTMDRPY